MMLPKIESVAQSEDYGRYQVEPLEPGFGVTLGNALRRVLLSSLPGAAITSIRIDNVYHEFTTIENVREDVTPDRDGCEENPLEIVHRSTRDDNARGKRPGRRHRGGHDLPRPMSKS